MIGFWATLSLNIPDFTRYGRGQRQQMLGQALGLPTTMVAFSAMAVLITGAAESLLKGVDPKTLWDPIVVLGHVTSASPPPGLSEPIIAGAGTRLAVAIIALLGVAVATISTNIAANVVSPANDFANVAPRFISFRTGGIITGVLGILMMPWKLLANPEAYVFEWLVGYSALLGPIAGIMIVDYWILRKCTLDVPELYRPRGRFAGVNPVAMAALALGVAPNVPGFLRAVKVVGGEPGWADAIYPYAWFSGFAIAAVAYAVGMRIRPGFGVAPRG
jgi:NCS1 family nucleobase:cation symporter-1